MSAAATAILTLFRANWRWLLPSLAMAGLGIALLLARADARHWRKKYDRQIELEHLAEAQRKTDKAIAEAGFARMLQTATADYAERLANRAPLILHSKDTVREYAQTEAGRVRCLGPDRVRGIEDYDRALGDTAPAAARTGALHDPASAQAE